MMTAPMMILESAESFPKVVDDDVRPLLHRLQPLRLFFGKLPSEFNDLGTKFCRCRCCRFHLHPVNVAHNGIDVAPHVFFDFRNLLLTGQQITRPFYRCLALRRLSRLVKI